MNQPGAKSHWEAAYSAGEAEKLSWHQDEPTLSLELIQQAGTAADTPLIDVGGGASRLVDHLLDRGLRDLTVLDLSAAALQLARQRLGARAGHVQWIEADITTYELPRRYGLWHDRAAFHFLTEAKDRAAYLRRLDRALDTGGQLVIATFAPDGPQRCSGLDIVRYDAVGLAAELGPNYRLEEQRAESHRTPRGVEQRFGFYRFTKMA